MITRSEKGFTLAEVLIALALLGVVAAFTIPKVLNSSGNQEAVAKVKETVATLEEAWYNMKLQNTYVTGSPLYNSFVGNANGATFNTVNQAATSVDAANAPLNSITNHPCGDTASETGWVQFANGVVISGLATAVNIPADLSTAANNYLLCIDINGASGANTTGTDVFFANFNSSGRFHNGITASANNKNFFYGDTTGPVVASGAPAAAPGTAASVRPNAGGTAAALTAINGANGAGNVASQLLK